MLEVYIVKIKLNFFKKMNIQPLLIDHGMNQYGNNKESEQIVISQITLTIF